MSGVGGVFGIMQLEIKGEKQKRRKCLEKKIEKKEEKDDG